MSRRIKSIKGLFGQTIHYKDGIKIGESWRGLFEGSLNHYDADGRFVGYSDRGIIKDLVHYDEHGSYIGETHTALFRQRKHFDAECRYTGETWEGQFGNTTDLEDEHTIADILGTADSSNGDDW